MSFPIILLFVYRDDLPQYSDNFSSEQIRIFTKDKANKLTDFSGAVQITYMKGQGRFAMAAHHRLRPIDTHLASYTMLYNNSEKNRYAEPVHNKTIKIFKIRD